MSWSALPFINIAVWSCLCAWLADRKNRIVKSGTVAIVKWYRLHNERWG
ncbi:MAG: hypothetical protein JWR21_4370 [Herminiimonas sp.]|nr:hypothetical protein [Herminiimonas sp.]